MPLVTKNWAEYFGNRQTESEFDKIFNNIRIFDIWKPVLAVLIIRQTRCYNVIWSSGCDIKLMPLRKVYHYRNIRQFVQSILRSQHNIKIYIS